MLPEVDLLSIAKKGKHPLFFLTEFAQATLKPVLLVGPGVYQARVHTLFDVS